MKKLLASLTLAMHMLASPAYAEVTCRPGDANKCSAPIQKGEVSPLTGQVLSTELAVSLGQKAAEADARVKLAVQQEKERSELKLQHEQLLSTIELEAEQNRTTYWRDRAIVAEKGPPFYERPAFVIPVTVVTVVGLVLVSTKVIEATAN